MGQVMDVKSIMVVKIPSGDHKGARYYAKISSQVS
jgi:hypothetical protein